MKDRLGIVILGNGYDLFHKKKTSYTSFIEKVKSENEQNLWINYFHRKKSNGWIDIENEIKKILDDLNEFGEDYPHLRLDQAIKTKYSNLLIFLSCRIGFKVEPIRNGTKGKTNFEYITIKFVDNHCRHFFGAVNLQIRYLEINKRIIEDFKDLKKKLKKYIRNIQTINKNYTKHNSINKNINGYQNLIVLNFNYTNTMNFYNDNIKNIFIHGDVKNGIILGHNGIKKQEFAIFDKKIQEKIIKQSYKYEFITIMNQLCSSREGYWDFCDLIVLGHSLDKNDHSVIKWIYQEIFMSYGLEIDKLKVFYYDDKSTNSDQITKFFNLRNFYLKTLDFLNPESKKFTGKEIFNKLESENRIEFILLEKGEKFDSNI